MTAILCMSMIMYPAGPVVDNMRHNDQQHRYGKQPELVMMPQLLGYQEAHSRQENE